MQNPLGVCINPWDISLLELYVLLLLMVLPQMQSWVAPSHPHEPDLGKGVSCMPSSWMWCCSSYSLCSSRRQQQVSCLLFNSLVVGAGRRRPGYTATVNLRRLKASPSDLLGKYTSEQAQASPSLPKWELYGCLRPQREWVGEPDY